MLEWFPILPLTVQSLMRVVYGVLMLLFLLIMSPFSRIYFTSEKYKGCLQSTKWTDRLCSPFSYHVIMMIWPASLCMIIFNVFTPFFCLINWLLCYNFFIRMRWSSPLRGMGAPGFISYWLGSFFLLAESAIAFGDPGGITRSWVVLMFRLDFAIMMLDSGINKIFHGYPQNKGMNFGMVNPAWGYWPNFFRKFRSKSPLFSFFNHSAYFFQILGAICLLFPFSYPLGAFIIFGSFFIVALIIRLGVLCPQLMLSTFLYTRENGIMDQLASHNLDFLPSTIPGAYHFEPLNVLIGVLAIVYVLILPLAKIGMYLNFYFKVTFPSILQKSLDAFTNAVGVILWRVFTIELIDYYILAYFEKRHSRDREIVTRFGRWKPRLNNRFLWVGESIMSVVLFNSVRYFKQSDMFQKRLLCYANTLQCPDDSIVIFEWVVLSERSGKFTDIKAKEYRVDLLNRTVEEHLLSSEALHEQNARTIAVHASAKPGSYAPAKS